eukprot:403343387
MKQTAKFYNNYEQIKIVETSQQPQSFMNNDIKSMFDDARKQIRNKFEKVTNIDSRNQEKQQPSFLSMNDAGLVGGFGSRDTSYRLSHSYLPDSKQDNSLNPATLSQRQSLANLHQSSNQIEKASRRDLFQGQKNTSNEFEKRKYSQNTQNAQSQQHISPARNLRELMQLKENKNVQQRQTKIDMLKSDLRQMLSSNNGMSNDQSMISGDTYQDRNRFSHGKSSTFSVNNVNFQTQDNNAKILISQLISPSQKSAMSLTPTRQRSREKIQFTEVQQQNQFTGSKSPRGMSNQFFNQTLNQRDSKTPNRQNTFNYRNQQF